MSQSAAQICLSASQIAKGGRGMIALAGQALNFVLDDLKKVRNLKINRVTQPNTILPAASYGPIDLPVNYLRTYDLFYPLPTSGGGTASSMTQFLVLVTMDQFDAEFKSPSISNYPYEFATDTSVEAKTASTTQAGQFYIYPQTSGQIVATHRYFVDRPDIAGPETSSAVPWFPQQQYLVNATAAQLMLTTGDDRYEAFSRDCERLLSPYLIAENDEVMGGAVINVRLDPRHFHFNRGLKPTKASPL